MVQTYAGQCGKAGGRIAFRRNGLAVECFFADTGRMRRKIEFRNGNSTEFTYRFDGGGRLINVCRDGMFAEQYAYNDMGQRVEQHREYRGCSDLTGGPLRYDDRGYLDRAGDTTFEYDQNGVLAGRCDCRGITRYFYGKDTLPDKVLLPSREEIRYEYAGTNPLCAVRRFKNGKLSIEYAWRDALHLSSYRDHELQLEYRFAYDDSGVLDKVRVVPLASSMACEKDWWEGSTDWLGSMVGRERKDRLHELLQTRGGKLELLCGCDQVGTLTVLTEADGVVFKEILRDSFGLRLHETLGDLFMPIGFGGGVEDPDTGLVRFGYREYDPSVGRFTAPDPLGDTGGDHDLYEYCVDDPVSMNDPTGLNPAIAAGASFLVEKLAAFGIGLGGAYAVGKAVDSARSQRENKESTAARDAVKGVAPKAAGAGALSMAPGMMLMAPGASQAVGNKVGSALMNSRYGNTLLTGATYTGQFAEPFIVEGPPSAITVPGGVGAVVNELLRLYNDNTK